LQHNQFRNLPRESAEAPDTHNQATDTNFSASPLITPERLKADLHEAFKLKPAWTGPCGLADEELPWDDNVLVLAAGQKHIEPYQLDTVSGAALFELTRFGNSVTTNRNTRAGDPAERWYLKMTFSDAQEDNMPVSRLVTDAQPRQAVRVGENRRDLRWESLTKQGAGKPTTAARETAVAHAERAARLNSPEGFDVAAYVANLWALFLLHDEVCAGV
jgi:hypothetical protein